MDRIFLKAGAHETMEQGGCVMEFAAWVAGEPHSDHPQCVSRVVGAYARRLNDWLTDDERQQLLPFAIEAIGTAGNAAHDRTRMFLAADAAVRIFLPLALDRRDPSRAATLRALPEIIDRGTAQRGRKAAAAADAAYAAAAADAAASAADAAASAADAASAAFAFAAAAAAFAAAYAARAAVVCEALALFGRLCAVGRAEVPLIEERAEMVRACAQGRPA